MEALLTKENLIKAVQDLPEGFTTEDVIERILLLEAIEEGIQQGERGEAVPDEDFYKHLPQWLA